MLTPSKLSARPVRGLPLFAALTLFGLLSCSRAPALVRPARETTHAAIWRKLYDQLPEAWKSREVVVVREVSDREMDRLVREHGDGPSRDSEDEDEVQGFFEYTGPRENIPTITLRELLSDSEAAFVFTHEYGHFVWEAKLTKRELGRLLPYSESPAARGSGSCRPNADDFVVEGFAEAFAHYLRQPGQLHRKDGLSGEFLEDWLDRAIRPPTINRTANVHVLHELRPAGLFPAGRLLVPANPVC